MMLQTDFAQRFPLSKLLLRQRTSPPKAKDSQGASRAQRRFPVGSLLVGAFLCLLGVGVYIWPRVQGVRLGYRLQGAEHRLKDLIQERDHLRLELAALSAPRRVYHMATEQLGMVTPTHDQVFVLTRESKSR